MIDEKHNQFNEQKQKLTCSSSGTETRLGLAKLEAEAKAEAESNNCQLSNQGAGFVMADIDISAIGSVQAGAELGPELERSSTEEQQQAKPFARKLRNIVQALVVGKKGESCVCRGKHFPCSLKSLSLFCPSECVRSLQDVVNFQASMQNLFLSNSHNAR